MALCAAAVMFAIHHYQYRFVRSESDMIALLPGREATAFFADVAALRGSRVLQMIAGSKKIQEPEYQEFIRQTHFDYFRDVDTVAGAFEEERVVLIIRGRFDWRSLRAYSLTHGGLCADDLCSLPASKPGRWASFRPIQPDVMGLVVGSDKAAAGSLFKSGGNLSEMISPAPVWISLSRTLLQNPQTAPLPARIFAICLQSAERVELSFDVAASNASPFELRLDAPCPTAATAQTIKSQLELETKALRLELAREHRLPNPSDLTGLLVAGTFATADTHVIGTWPVHIELLRSLQ